ncbi:hypothetical protein HNO52_06385 [Billgrantia diversa]|uniref:hypothetical protein n=1 Tax=Halomonas sp. MCCC 1A13316 TaxID=2733487 RepID=UPI0018A54B4B|nr:hypothetical protein [Halomonas sp. MCCC 1A13316]QOR38178.1 hypothetical protein HNO52_06385 [Halomonas sp. MCCC 1A13316]
MHSRSVSWLLCLLLGIALALPQMVTSAWSASDDCQGEAYSMPDQASLPDSDANQAHPGEKVACTAPCPVCNSAPMLYSSAPRSLEPRWATEEVPLHTPRDRPERPPRA